MIPARPVRIEASNLKLQSPQTVTACEVLSISQTDLLRSVGAFDCCQPMFWSGTRRRDSAHQPGSKCRSPGRAKC